MNRINFSFRPARVRMSRGMSAMPSFCTSMSRSPSMPGRESRLLTVADLPVPGSP